MDWSIVPEPALIRVFELLTVKERLEGPNCAALVCRRWAEAARTATTSISISRCADLDSLQLWLQEHGRNLTLLHVNDTPGRWSQLPCPKLVDLQLVGIYDQAKVYLTDRFTAAIAAITTLTRITLARVVAPPHDVDLWAAIAELPDLQHLVVGSVDCYDCGPADVRGLLQDFDDDPDSPSYSPQHPSYSLQPRLQKLTFLQLHNISDDLTPETVPGIGRLPALKCLSMAASLSGCFFQPSCIASSTQLEDLYMIAMDVSNHTGVSYGEELMKFLRMQQQLTNLELYRILGLDSGTKPQSYEAFTASSKLQKLELEALNLASDPAVWRHIFPPDRQLRELTALALTDTRPALTASDLQRLVQCCSALQQLKFNADDLEDAAAAEGEAGPSPPAPLAPLQQLRDLTSLDIASGVTDSMVTQLLCLMTNLRALELTGSGQPGRTSLQQLTALQQLTHFDVLALDVEDADQEGGINVKVTNKVRQPTLPSSMLALC